jgi:hypothetical protein
LQTKCLATVRLEVDERPERFESLQCPFEADAAGLDVMLAGSLGHDGANEVIRQHVRPEYLVNLLGRTTASCISHECILVKIPNVVE